MLTQIEQIISIVASTIIIIMGVIAFINLKND